MNERALYGAVFAVGVLTALAAGLGVGTWRSSAPILPDVAVLAPPLAPDEAKPADAERPQVVILPEAQGRAKSDEVALAHPAAHVPAKAPATDQPSPAPAAEERKPDVAPVQESAVPVDQPKPRGRSHALALSGKRTVAEPATKADVPPVQESAVPVEPTKPRVRSHALALSGKPTVTEPATKADVPLVEASSALPESPKRRVRLHALALSGKRAVTEPATKADASPVEASSVPVEQPKPRARSHALALSGKRTVIEPATMADAPPVEAPSVPAGPQKSHVRSRALVVPGRRTDAEPRVALLAPVPPADVPTKPSVAAEPLRVEAHVAESRPLTQADNPRQAAEALSPRIDLRIGPIPATLAPPRWAALDAPGPLATKPAARESAETGDRPRHASVDPRGEARRAPHTRATRAEIRPRSRVAVLYGAPPAARFGGGPVLIRIHGSGAGGRHGRVRTTRIRLY